MQAERGKVKEHSAGLKVGVSLRGEGGASNRLPGRRGESERGVEPVRSIGELVSGWLHQLRRDEEQSVVRGVRAGVRAGEQQQQQQEHEAVHQRGQPWGAQGPGGCQSHRHPSGAAVAPPGW